MDQLDIKIIQNLKGKVVRKDLTALLKKGANVPTYVLEYLLGMYCTSEDENKIKEGMKKIQTVLANNYVHPEQSEYIKSKIKETGQYTIIDKISVRLDEREDVYVASFTNLKISPFIISPDIVVHNEKLLIGGIWCIVKIKYKTLVDKEEEYEINFYDDEKTARKKAKKSKFLSPFSIEDIRPIQMPNLNMDTMFETRTKFTNEEWITLLLRSAGYEPDELEPKQKLHYLLRFVPFTEKNYNLVELGPRGTGKSHVYSEISPYSILMSSGTTTVSNMFYNMSSRKVGLVGSWDCIAFDEVGGINNTSTSMIQTLKNYMANGSFARGTEQVNADASIAFEGNTFRSVSEMLRVSSLFEPFPSNFNNDSAFFDRIHAYLPGWETPKLRASLFTKRYGLISDCLAEFCHLMRKYDYTNNFNEYFALNKNFNTRDDTAVRKTFSGLAKLIYPNLLMSKEECKELLEYSIELRRRVKEQLKKMNPSEFTDTDLGYIDLETGEETIINIPEQARKSLVFEGYEIPGYVYGVGKSETNKVGVYRLENKLIAGTGKFEYKNMEGVSYRNKKVRDSITAAFNYFTEHCNKIIVKSSYDYDYTLYFNDLQSKGMTDEISVAEVVGLFSAITNRSVLPGLVICGKVVMSGSMLPVSTNLEDIFIQCKNAGAKRLFIPSESEKEVLLLKPIITDGIKITYYNNPLDATRKALRLDD